MSQVGALSVLPVAQTAARFQRRGRFVAESGAHPARMLPELTRRLIDAYSLPGDLVFDPMCGIGTTLVEAVHAGRNAIGVEYEPRWAAIARRNVRLACASGATGGAAVVTGDARRATELVPSALAGRVALIVTSPPYGSSLHGTVRCLVGQVVKTDHRYSTSRRDRHNLAHAGRQGLLDGFQAILAECHALLRPGGVVAMTARPWRAHDRLIDLPGSLIGVGESAGLVPRERLVALLCGLRGDTLVPHHSLFALLDTRRAHARGLPLRVIAHEDVLVFTKTSTP